MLLSAMVHPAVREYFQKITSQGGKARAAKLTKKQRKEIAQKAAKARWAKKPTPK